MKRPRPPSLASIRAAKKPDKVPLGWYTRSELEREWNLSRDYAGRLIKDAIFDGRCEVQKFSVLTDMRGIYPTPHYRFK
jgi:hypothetical protein